MVLALGVLAVLAVLAMIVAAMVVSEKKSAFFDYSGARSFYSADAATEAGVNWLRANTTPPPVLDASQNVRVANTFTDLGANHSYKFNVQYVRKRPRPGWSLEYKDYEYDVAATGASVKATESAVDVAATRLYREGY
jgi:hypothetical protein